MRFKGIYKTVDYAFSALTYTMDEDLSVAATYVRRDELVILGLVLSLFASAVLAAAGMFAICGYLVWQGRLKTILAAVENSGYLLVFCLVTLAVSLISRNLQGVFIAFVMCAMFIVSLFIRSVMTRELFEKIIDVGCLASLLGFVVIVIQKLATMDDPTYRAASTFLNANYYGAITDLVVLLCIYKMIQPGQKHWQYYLVIGILNHIGLNLSNCRSAVAALAVSILVILLLNKRYRAMGIMLVVETLNIASFYLVPSLMPRIGHAGMDFMYRAEIWKTSIQGILAHPFFGQGGGSYRLIFAGFGGPDEMHAHSLYLDPLLNFGIVGVTFLAVYYRSNLKYIRNLIGNPQDQPRLFLLLAVLVCIAIHGVMDITVFSVQTGLLVSILMGVAGIRENPQAG